MLLGIQDFDFAQILSKFYSTHILPEFFQIYSNFTHILPKIARKKFARGCGSYALPLSLNS